MAHTVRDQKKLLDRIRRIRGQVEGIEKALEDEKDPFFVLQTVASCRGALNSLMAEIIEGHIRYHVIDPTHPPTPEQADASQELIDIVRAFLK
jgi:FrmR/RcnR family transcriptional regulator, repressor of frmRAB operon